MTRDAELPAFEEGKENALQTYGWRFVLVASLLTPGYATAADKTWTGANSSSWSAAGNWSGGVPAAADNALINTVSPNPAVIGTGVTGAAAQVRLGTASGGNGSLTLTGGGKLNNTLGLIGNAAGSTGTATVTGTGSRWTNSGTLNIGAAGSGSLTVSSGGAASAAASNVGNSAGSTGSVTVTNAGSTWSTVGNQIVGNAGSGTLTVSTGGASSAGNSYVGNIAGSTGSVTVTGAGSTWTSTNGQIIGSAGSGSLQILNGGKVTGGTTRLGQSAGSIGTVLVSGAGSRWTSTSLMNVGLAGSGHTLTVADQGEVVTQEASLGNFANATGTVAVTGAGSKWTTTGSLNFGIDGTGAFTVSNGGIASVNNGSVGTNSGSGGTLLINSGGSFSGTTLKAGTFAGANGSVTVQGIGSALTTTGEQFIGAAGTGSLKILDGATVSGAITRVGSRATSNSTALISGRGSTWTSTSSMTVGYQGAGTARAENGGRVVTANTTVGDEAGASGGVTVTGAGSTWSSTGNTTIGNAGTGRLTVSAGGVVSAVTSYVGNATGSSGSVTVSGTGSSWTHAGEQFIGVAGSGSLQILAGGTVSAGTAWVGKDAGASGNVLIDGAGSRWTISGDLTIGNSGAGAVTLSSQAELSAAGIRIADLAGSSGTLNIGAASAAAAAQAGRANAGSLTFGSGAGTLVLNHTDNAYLLSATLSGAGAIRAENGRTIIDSDSTAFLGNTAILSGATLQVGDGASSGAFGGSIANNGQLVFDRANDSAFTGAISGAGSLTKNGAGTLALSGNSSAFTGPTTLATGGLAISGALGGMLTAQSGTVLSGTGSIGGIAAADGSTITPGNTVGSDVAMLTVTGNYHQFSGSTYQAGLVPQGTLSDMIAVGGTATLDSGTVLNVTNLGASVYGINDVYTVLTAAGGVSGTYLLTGDTAVSAFYELQAVYEANAVLLKVVQVRDFADAAQTPNQIATADGLSSLPAENELRDAVGSLDSEEETRGALDLLSGEIYASTAGAIAEDSRYLRDAVLGRLRCTTGHTAAQPDSCMERAVWIEGYGASSDSDGDGNAAAMDTQIEGFYIGADIPVSANARIGLFTGHGTSDVTVDDRHSSAAIESYDFGAYGSANWNNIGLRLGASYGWNDVATSRQVAFTGFSDHLSADYTARAAQVFGELGYSLAAGPAAFEPFAALAHVNVESEAFTESGGAAALNSDAQNTSLTLATLGLRGSATAQIFDFDVKASGMAGWQHGWGDLTPDMAFSFDGGSDFGIQGVPAAGDAAVLEAGLTIEAPGEGTFGLWYTGQFSQDTQSQGLRANLAFTF